MAPKTAPLSAAAARIRPQGLRISQRARDLGERIELLAMGRFGEQEKKDDVDRLIVDGLEIDAAPQTRQKAKWNPEPG